MADIDKDQERTEQASPRRREEAHKKGQVARSPEVPSAAILLACTLLFYFGSSGMLERMMDLTRWILRECGTTTVSLGSIETLFWGWAWKLFLIMAPLLLTVVVAGFLSNYLQIGFIFAPEAIAPKFEKIDPLKGFQRLFSLRSLVELIKSILKMAVVAAIVWFTLKDETENLIPLMDESLMGILVYSGKVSFRIMITTCWVLIILALLDYLYQRWEYEKGLRMSRQEVKDEYKQAEGDPLVKARIRRIQREIARKRMMAKVPKADVVITNPTHLAVAIQYDADRMYAPVVVAKGAGYVAETIKEIARANKVPVIENKPVAQLLYKTVDVDRAIPEDLYRAVAEILAYVYGLKEHAV
ncbi:MAG TPA: flagellar biosynthesis protein FlhB [Syntrophales bacterium]|nr:flagellar biosynthesis protein FlhB [Syntrophales bacterium]